MLGFLIGTACLIGLIKVARHGRGWGYAHGCGYGGDPGGGGCGHSCGGHGHHGHGHGWRGGWGSGQGFGGGGRNVLLRGLFSRLETTPGQEKAIRSALDQLFETVRQSRQEWRDTSELSTLLRGDTFDRTSAEGLSGKADASFARVRVAMVEALAQIHEALDDRQRRILADFLESRGGFFRGGWGGGPYRSAGGGRDWV